MYLIVFNIKWNGDSPVVRINKMKKWRGIFLTLATFYHSLGFLGTVGRMEDWGIQFRPPMPNWPINWVIYA